MSKLTSKLKNAPIVEAVLDIDCDMPPSQQLKSLETKARDSFRAAYPRFRSILMQEHRIEAKPEGQPQMSTQHSFQGFQFLKEDGKQLVQVRIQGFSFNRLAPYTTLDDYAPEIERTWNLFMQLVSPVQVRMIRLRYINRILLPVPEGRLKLEDYFKICPHLPDEEKLRFLGFLNQHAAREVQTGNQVNIILAAQPLENKMFPVIFDITVASMTTFEPSDWAGISKNIESLRSLKNEVFRNTLTDKCLKLFQQ